MDDLTYLLSEIFSAMGLTVIIVWPGPEKGTSLILTRLERKQSVMCLRYENLEKEAEM